MKAFSLKGGENMFIKLLKKMRSQKGFTLIELVFVVVILAILAGVALINLGSTDTDAKVSAAKTDMRTLATAIKVYKAKTGTYPVGLSDLTVATGTGSTKYNPMIDTVPTDPSNSGSDYGYNQGTDMATLTRGSSSTEQATMTIH
jgi:general secretion pathway protein G